MNYMATFPKIGVPPSHPFCFRIFHEINHSAIGDPPWLWKSPYGYIAKIDLMWVKQYHKPPMTGNRKHTSYKNGDDWGDGACKWHCFNHMKSMFCCPCYHQLPLAPEVLPWKYAQRYCRLIAFRPDPRKRRYEEFIETTKIRWFKHQKISKVWI